MPTCPVGFKCFFEVPIDPGIWLIAFGVFTVLIGWFFMSRHRKDRDRSNLERQEVELQKKGNELLSEIRDELKPKKVVTGFNLTQLTPTRSTEMITGVPVGGTGVFQSSPLPAGVSLPAGSVLSYSADNPSITLSQNPSDQTQFSASALATETATSFNLTVSATDNGAGSPVSSSFNIPILPSTGGGGTVTGFALNQLS